MLIQQDRGSGPLGEHLLDDISVTGNTIDPADGMIGAVTDIQGSNVFERNLHFTDNTYEVDPGALSFTWDTTDLDQAGWEALGMS